MGELKIEYSNKKITSFGGMKDTALIDLGYIII